MSVPSKVYDDLQTPFTDKSGAKLLGFVFSKESFQAAAVTAASPALHVWQATFDGQLGDAYVVIDAALGASEVMVYDLVKNGTSVLTAALTLAEGANPTVQHKLPLDPDLVNFKIGDVFECKRTYTAGAGLMEGNSVVIEPTTGPIA